MRVAFSIAGSLAVEGSVIRWVADHRRHHMFTDRPGDPHSPHLAEGEGLKGILAGLWHAHIGWFFVEDTTSVARFAPDLLRDRPVRTVSSLFPLWTVASFALAPAIALAFALQDDACHLAQPAEVDRDGFLLILDGDLAHDS